MQNDELEELIAGFRARFDALDHIIYAQQALLLRLVSSQRLLNGDEQAAIASEISALLQDFRNGTSVREMRLRRDIHGPEDREEGQEPPEAGPEP